MAKLNINITEENSLYNDVGQIINKSRQRLASLANTEICMMHWHIGKRIKEDVLYSQRAEYGKQILKNLSNKLSTQFGKGWSDRKLLHCIRCAYTFTEDEIIYAVSIQLTWTHLRSLMFIEERLKRQFYMEMTRIEHWNTRTLDHKIEELLYERTALSRKPEELIKQELQKIQTTDLLTPDIVFRSSYFFDAIGLTETYTEKFRRRYIN